MHRLIFCTICLLALLGVFGPGNFGSSARTATVAASGGSAPQASVALTAGQPLALSAQQGGDLIWTVRTAPPEAQQLVGQTLARGSARLALSAAETRRTFATPGTYVLRAEGPRETEEFVGTVDSGR